MYKRKGDENVKTLVVGGTGLVGSHITKTLLKSGHNVTIATRGVREDEFGNKAARIFFDRTNPPEIATALDGSFYDVVYDTQAYSSNEIKYLLDSVNCGRYIEVSTVAVYAPDFGLMLREADFDPLKHPLKWCSRTDFAYDEIKRQAECAMYQAYGHIPSVAVRLPFVVGMDDDSKRLHFYVKNILSRTPMYIDNIDARLSFVQSCEAGRFIAWLADTDICGPVNIGSIGDVSLAEIITYVEGKTGINAVLADDGERGAYNSSPSHSMNYGKVARNGGTLSSLRDWIFTLLDELIKYMRNA